MMTRISKPWRDSWCDFRGAYLIILSVLVLLAGFLVWAPKPWDSGVSAALADGDELRPKHYVVSGLWVAAWLNIAIVAGVASLGPWLFRSLPEEMPSVPEVPGDRRIRGLLPLILLVAAVVGGVIQAPRLSHSLWGDEEYTAKRYVVGYYRRDSDEGLELKEPEWIWTAWDFRRGPSNHQLFSILSRISHSFHEPSGDPEEPYFSEVLIRLPSFLASLGTIFMVGWLAALFGGVRAGAIAALLLAVHPWFIRYGPEARGYGLMMMLLALGLVLFYKAVIGGRWRHWMAFGVVEFLVFISYLGSLHFILLLNLSGLLLVAFGQRRKAARWPQIGRFVVANTTAAALVIMMIAPTIEPTRQWLARTTEASAFGAAPDLSWVIDAACELATGLTWFSWDASNPLALHLADKPLLLTVPLLALSVLFLIMGALRLCVKSKVTALMVPVMLLPAPAMVIHAKLGGSFMFSWYLLVALPAVVVLIALGIDWLGNSLWSGRKAMSVAITVAVVFMALLAVTTWDRVHLLRTQSVEPSYETVALTRNILNPADPAIDEGVVTVGFSMWSQAYDPAARQVRNADELRSVMAQARVEGKELYVNFGQYGLAKQNVGDIMEMIEDESLFEPIAILPGLWQPCTRWVYRAKPDD